MLDNLVQQLGRELNMQDQIVSREPGHFTIPLEGNINVDVIQCPQNFVLKARIEAIPAKGAESFLARTMEADLYGKGTRGAVIGLNAEGNLLTLSMEVENECSYKVFHDKMEDFITMVDYWRNEVVKSKF